MPDINNKPLKSEYGTPNPLLSNKTYDWIKNIVVLAFPLFITAYSGLGALWGWPDVERWVTTGGIVGVLLGGLIKIAEKQYAGLPKITDGTVFINTSDPGTSDVIVPDVDLSSKDTVTLQVINEAS